MGNVWKIKEKNETLIEEYEKKFKVSKMLAQMLVAKNIAEDEVETFLNPTIDNLHNPYLLNDMEKLVTRVLKAKEENENIVIYGDYDVDGITSITVLHSFLKDIGIASTYYLPDRLTEGYGLNNAALLKLKEGGATLVITVDCGISAIEEAKYAKSIGLDLVITDHHECGEVLPEALAVVNPKRPDSNYPFAMLAGVGVTFKVINALAMKLGLEKESYLKYIDIVAMGTIADIVPLLGENRVITYNGITALKNTNNIGIKALMKVAGISKVTSDTVSFMIAPRINACGRMNDASIAVKLLLCDNQVKAYDLAKALDNQNIQRQAVEKQIYKEAIEIINEKELHKKKTIVIAKKGWHQGVIGIVASKLTEIYLKPVVLLAIDEQGKCHGSARIPQGLSLYAAISKCSEYLVSFGGHELAAGLSLDEKNVQNFADKFEETIKQMKSDEFTKTIEIDVVTENKNIDFNLIRDVARLAPFGQNNKMPTFLCKNFKVTSISTLKENKHLKFTLQDCNNNIIDAIYFGGGTRRDEVVLGDKIDLVFTVNVNVFMGNIKIQYMVVDFKKCI